MNGYIINFIVYTMAMVGIMLISVMIYKKSLIIRKTSPKNTMQIEETLSLSPKKSLYIVKVKNERFLIASDMDRTTFLAKLDPTSDNTKDIVHNYKNINQITPSQKQINEIHNKQVLQNNQVSFAQEMTRIKSSLNENKSAIEKRINKVKQMPMKNLAKKITLTRG